MKNVLYYLSMAAAMFMGRERTIVNYADNSPAKMRRYNKPGRPGLNQRQKRRNARRANKY